MDKECRQPPEISKELTERVQGKSDGMEVAVFFERIGASSAENKEVREVGNLGGKRDIAGGKEKAVIPL